MEILELGESFLGLNEIKCSSSWRTDRTSNYNACAISSGMQTHRQADTYNM